MLDSCYSSVDRTYVCWVIFFSFLLVRYVFLFLSIYSFHQRNIKIKNKIYKQWICQTLMNYISYKCCIEYRHIVCYTLQNQTEEKNTNMHGAISLKKRDHLSYSLYRQDPSVKILSALHRTYFPNRPYAM